ncbi:MAG: hypothetical protein ACRC3G_05560, partial [Bacteroidales bacterium]
DPQSPIYGQVSCISTNVSPQSIREFFFLFALRGGGLRVKPAMTCKGKEGRCRVSVLQWRMIIKRNHSIVNAGCEEC